VPKASFKLDGIFLNNTEQEIAANLKDFEKEAEAEKFLEQAKTTEFKVLNVETKPGTRSASAPFTTSTLQQEASSRLGYNVTNTMRLAQRLYEEGFITYMRTDSVNLSQEAIEGAKNKLFQNTEQNILLREIIQQNLLLHRKRTKRSVLQISE
jgi:DNA topoisomerase-1